MNPVQPSRIPFPPPRLRPRRGVLLLAAVLLAGCGGSAEDRVDSARKYLARDDMQAASIELKSALQKDAALPEARFLLGQVNLELGDIPGAVKELRRAGELGYPAERVIPLLATALMRSGEFDTVIRDYGSVRLDDPAAQARLLSALGSAHLAKAEPARARALFDSALALKPDDHATRVELARAWLLGGEPQAAGSELERVLGANPGHAGAHALRADIARSQGQLDDAVSALQAALRERPQDLNLRLELASLLLQRDRVEEARQQVGEMNRQAPNSPATLFLLAALDLRDGKLESARDRVQQTLRTAPDYLPAHLLAGSVFLRMDQHVQAQLHFSKVLERIPGEVQARRMMALSLSASGQTERARDMLQPLIDADLNDVATLSVIGQVLMASGEVGRAADYLARAAAVAPDDADVRRSLGMVRMVGGDAERAMADLQAAARLEPEALETDTAMVLAHLRNKDHKAALEAIEALARKHPGSAEVMNLKGGVLAVQQDRAGARAAFEAALRLRPDLLQAAVNLARIDLADGQPQAAVARLEAFVRANPANPDARLAHVRMLATTGAAAERIVPALQEAVAALPGQLPLRLALVRAHLAAGETRKALGMAQELAAAHATDPGVVETLAQAQFAMGDHQQAISSFGRLAGLLPQSPEPLLRMAAVQLSAGSAGAAEQTLRRALAMRPDLLRAHQPLLAILLQQQRMDDALAHARGMQGQPATAGAGHAAEGDVHARRGNWGAATQAYGKALQQAASGENTVKYGVALQRSGRGGEAERLFAEWLRDQPRDIVVRRHLADRAAGDGRHADARRLYREIMALEPDDAMVLNNLAWVSGKLRDPEALALAERALALQPDSPYILDTLGMLQIEKGDAERGLASLNRAVSLAPGQATLRLNLAKAYLKLSRPDDARKELDAVLAQVAPDSPLHGEARALRAGL